MANQNVSSVPDGWLWAPGAPFNPGSTVCCNQRKHVIGCELHLVMHILCLIKSMKYHTMSSPAEMTNSTDCNMVKT